MKKSYKIEVDCANCAAKIEAAINKLEGVSKATVNFMTQKLILEAERDHAELLPLIQKAGKKVDDDFEIVG